MQIHLRTPGNAGAIQQRARSQSHVPLTHTEHARASEQVRGAQLFLHLQQQYGNRYVQRSLAQAKEKDGAGKVAPDVEQIIQGARGDGQALDGGVRAQMESAFGADFGGVQIHTDTQTDMLSCAPNVGTYTIHSSTLLLPPSSLIHRSSSGNPSNIQHLDELLGKWDVPEEKVIELLGKLTSAEKKTVLYGGYKNEIAAALSISEMVRAVTNLNPALSVKLEWVEAAASRRSSIDYYDIRPMIISASQTRRNALKTRPWREFFVDVCTNESMLEAVNDLNFDLPMKTAWMVTEGLDEEKLATYYLTLLPVQSSLVIQSLQALNRHDRDDVAYALVKAASDDLLKRLYADEAGKTLVTLILSEFADGWNSESEKKQRDRLLNVAPNDRPKAMNQSSRNTAKASQTSAAQNLIDIYTSWGNLREDELAKNILSRLPVEWALADKILDILESRNKDDVSLALLTAASDDQIKAIGSDTNGKALFLRMVHEMYIGDMSKDERKQMQRTMRLITGVDRKQKGATTEVEVVTFLFGGSLLNFAGTVFSGGTKGHTLIIIGNLVYSFEYGWSCGQTREEYFGANTWRDAIGQKLDLKEEDARKVQDKLNDSCGTGTYIISGDICTDSAGIALEQALGTLNAGWNPQRFVGKLQSTGKVKSRHFYPRTKN